MTAREPEKVHLCYSCYHHVNSVKREGYKKCDITNLLLNYHGDPFYVHIDKIGCASHSAAIRPHPAPAPDDIDLEEIGNRDIDPVVFEAYAKACDRGAQEQFLIEQIRKAREDVLDDILELIEEYSYIDDCGDVVVRMRDIRREIEFCQQQDKGGQQG